MLTPELLTIIVGIVSAPIGAWLGSKLERRKYETELRRLDGELSRQSAEIKAGELDNVRRANEILMETVVEPLRMEIKQLRDEVDRLNQALGQIPSCPHAHTCPITRRLRHAPRQADGDDTRVQQSVDAPMARLPPSSS